MGVSAVVDVAITLEVIEDGDMVVIFEVSADTVDVAFPWHTKYLVVSLTVQ